MRLVVERLGKPISERPFEIVERKGLGHPDTISDAVAERISVNLSRYYLDHFGAILHHNVDKVTLIAGKSQPAFGGGEVIRPMKLVIVGRATAEVAGEPIPLHEIVRTSVDEVFSRFHAVEKDHYTYKVEIGEGSADLKAVVERTGMPLANDTSVGVGHAPLSPAEEITLKIEETLNDMISREPAVGEDIKVMTARDGGSLFVTVATAMVGKFLPSIEAYERAKEKVRREVERLLEKEWDGEFSVRVNAADSVEEGVVYLTVTGLSAENGDDGAVGRGNRQVGFIPVARSVSLEAVAGKNPTSHVGKLYNVASRIIAQRLVEEGAKEAEVFLLSEIGKPVNEPQLVAVRLVGELPRDRVRHVVQEVLDSLPEISLQIVEGKHRLF